MGEIILVHSPLVGPTSLSPTARTLESLGRRCLAPSPSVRAQRVLAWRDWPSALLSQIADVEAPVIVGHSMGGLLAAWLAGALRARGMICLDAYMPPERGPSRL